MQYVNRFSSSDRHLCNLFLQISIKGSLAEISRMIFDGREYTSVEFEGLYRAGEYREFGSMMFQVNTSLHIHQDACPDQVGVTVFFSFSFCNNFFHGDTNKSNVTYLMFID